MYNKRLGRVLIIAGLFLFSLQAFGLEVPKLNRRVTDLAGILSPSEEARLEENLMAFENETSNQIAVLIINSLDGESIEQYSIQVVDQWQLGTAQKDNGVLLLIAVQDRQVRIEVGYGLEGVLTDLISFQIIRNVIAPQFRNGNYYAGIDQGLRAIMMTTKNEYKGDPRQQKNYDVERGKSIASLVFMIIFILIFLCSGKKGRRNLLWALFFSNMFGGRGGGWRSGGGFGGFSGGGGGFGGGGASGRW
ncbi:MAG: YgcG family protein [Candidatus Marinimicrobia bacterium]|nr:YgcG family protein [Candidatus Neomarinimicrobiota bacterium]